jgi:cytochrome c-type biogenesis protein CcmH
MTDAAIAPDWNRRLKGVAGWLVLLFAAVALLVIGATADRGATTPTERAQALEQRLACPVCDGESLFESRNQAAVNLRNEIETLVNAGQLSDDEIIARIESRLNESLLLLPKSTGLDGLVWALPVAAFVCGAAGLVVAFRRWRLVAATENVPTDDDRALVAAALRQRPDDDD